MRIGVFVVVTMKIAAFWDVPPCSLTERYHYLIYVFLSYVTKSED